jgi:hypothetical protein
MKEELAVRNLLAHFMHRMNEFFNDCPAEEIEEKDLGTRFARWLYSKEALRHVAFKTAEGVVAQHFNAEEVSDEESFVVAQLKLFKDHGVGLLWMADLFVNPAMPMPDEMREMIVHTLRYHADRVERREIDERLKQVYKSTTGTT